MILDTEEQRQILLECVNGATLRGASARAVAAVLDALEGAPVASPERQRVTVAIHEAASPAGAPSE